MTSLALESQLNFKLLFIFIILTSCGLKKPLIAPEDNNLPSVPDKYKKKVKKNVTDIGTRK